MRGTAILLSMLVGIGPASGDISSFQRGDANVDAKVDIADAIHILDHLFGSHQALSCRDAADANDDGRLDIADPIYVLAHLFGRGAEPRFPFSWPGPDPRGDVLDCRSFRLYPERPMTSIGTGTIAAIDVFPSGNRIAVAGAAPTLLDSTGGGSLAPVAPFALETCVDIAVSPDGCAVAAAGPWYTLATLWDGETGELLKVLESPGYVNRVVFSPDGSMLLTIAAAPEGTRLWDARTGELLRSFERCVAAAFTPSGDRIVALGETLVGASIRYAALLYAVTGEPLQVGILETEFGQPLNIAVSPDGTWFAVGQSVGATVWNLDAMAQERAWGMGFMTACSGAIAFSPDGTMLAVGAEIHGEEYALLLVDVASGAVVDRVAQPSIATALDFSPDGGTLYSVTFPATIHSWDLTGLTRRSVYRFPGGGGYCRNAAVAIDPQDDTIAVGIAVARGALTDIPITLWDARTGRLVRQLGESTLNGAVDRVGVVPSSTRLFAVRYLPDGGISFWDGATGAFSTRFARPDTMIEQVVFSQTGDRVALSFAGGDVALWSLAEGREELAFHARARNVLGVWCSSDSARCVVASDAAVEIWDVQSEQACSILEDAAPAEMSLEWTFSPDGNHVLAPRFDGDVLVWDAVSGALLGTVPHFRGKEVVEIVMAPSGEVFAAKAYNGEIAVFRLSDLGLVVTLTAPEDGSLAHMAFSRDAQRVVYGGWTVLVWDIATGEAVLTLPASSLGEEFVYAVGFTGDGAEIIAGSALGRVYLVDVVTGSLQRTIDHEGVGNVTDLAFSPDGRTLLSGHGLCPEDSAIFPSWNVAVLWDLETGSPALRLSGDASAVRGVAYGHDGSRVATAHADGRVRVWDSATGALHAALLLVETDAPIASSLRLAFTADGEEIRAGVRLPDDGRVRVRGWNVDTGIDTFTLDIPIDYIPYDSVAGFAFLADGSAILVGPRLVSLPDGAIVRELADSGTLPAAVSADGRLAMVYARNERSRVWNLHTGARELTVEHGEDGNMLGTISSAGGFVVANTVTPYRLGVWRIPPEE